MSEGAARPSRDGEGGVPVLHASLMDAVYRRQRHIYDLTRKYYLLGRDRMLDDLQPADGDRVLEIGCGTGRNLILAARRYPRAVFYGIDISEEMLATARASVARAGLDGRIVMAQGDATDFSGTALFGIAAFERVYVSYALSMIPDWQGALDKAFDATKPGGRLHVVDFGGQERMPAWFRRLLLAWLGRFHVRPRMELPALFEATARREGTRSTFSPLFRGYAWLLGADRRGRDEGRFSCQPSPSASSMTARNASP